MTSGEVWDAWFKSPLRHGLRFYFGHGEACCFENGHNDGQNIRNALRRLLDTMSASSAYSMAHTAFRMHASGLTFTPSSRGPPRDEPSTSK